MGGSGGWSLGRKSRALCAAAPGEGVARGRRPALAQAQRRLRGGRGGCSVASGLDSGRAWARPGGAGLRPEAALAASGRSFPFPFLSPVFSG